MSDKTTKRRPAVRREGERFRVRLEKGAGTTLAKLSLAVSPSATGYTLKARTTSAEGAKLAIEHFAEAQGDSFAAAKLRADELAKLAVSRGWSERKSHRAAEDLI